MLKTIAVLDEHNSLEALIVELKQEGYRIVSYQDATALLSNVHSDQVDMVILDIKNSTGSEDRLLKDLKEQQPYVIRVALSQFSDSHHAFKAIEANLARLFLYRTWDIVSVIHSIRQLFGLEDQLNDPGLVAFINSINTLPTVPLIYMQVSKMIAQDVEVDKIAEVIESDPAICSSILRVANSAFYGAKTGSIAQAIMFIGLGNVKNIILGHSLFVQFKGNQKAEIFWEHAVLSNRIAHVLYEHFHQRKMPLVNSSAGLLHNVGQLLMLTKFGTLYLDYFDNFATVREDELLKTELEQFKLDHATLGAYLLNWWELPLNIVEVAMAHHKPSKESIKNKDIIAIVNMASQCAWYLIHNKNMDLLPTDESLFPFGLSRQRLKEIIDTRVQ